MREFSNDRDVLVLERTRGPLGGGKCGREFRGSADEPSQRIAVRKRSSGNSSCIGLDERVNGAIGADGEGQRKNRDQGDGVVFAKASEGDLEILGARVEGSPPQSRSPACQSCQLLQK